jgi:flagellar hook protein FlgE
MALSLDLSKSAQYGQKFAVSALNQDGYGTGSLSGISVSSEGVVQASYSNGVTKAIGQVALSSFASPQGLQQKGDNAFAETFASGQAVRGAAGTSDFGLVQGGALEASNVDQTAELVSMISAQRNFQANAQMIQTQDQITQTIINLR